MTTIVYKRLVTGGLAALFFCALSFAQPPANKPPKTILLDADGRVLTDNEFVDRRLANPQAKDPATKTVLEDGTIEFRLAKIPQEGTTAPVFETWTIDGKQVSTADLKGKVIVLNFWFIGCPGCIDEIPKLNAVAKKYAGSGDVIFISLAPDAPPALRRFRERNGFEYQMAGQAGPVLNLFAFNGFPRNIVIGRNGEIVYWRSVVRAWDKFESVINAELSKK